MDIARFPGIRQTFRHTCSKYFPVYIRLLLCVQVCQLAAAVEASSEHPLAKAVLEFAQAELSKPPQTAFSSSTSDLKGTSKEQQQQQQQQSAAPAGPHTVVTVAMYSLTDEEDGSPRCSREQQQRQGVLKHSSSSGPEANWSGSSTGSPRQRRGSTEMQPGLACRLGKQLAHSTGGLAAWAGHSEGGECPGSPVSTQTRLGRMLSSGLLKVSEVEVRNQRVLKASGCRGLQACVYLVVRPCASILLQLALFTD
jgi:hypothetical protein